MDNCHILIGRGEEPIVMGSKVTAKSFVLFDFFNGDDFLNHKRRITFFQLIDFTVDLEEIIDDLRRLFFEA